MAASSTTVMPAEPPPLGAIFIPEAHLLADLYRMTVDEYERLAEAEVLSDRRVELIGGYLVRKMTTKPPHAWSVDAARELLEGLIPAGWDIREEKPVRIPDFDEPEPDLAVVRGTRDDYRDRHPGPAHVGLVVEVSDSSLGWDRGAKLSAYARSGVPCYWIINLVDRQVEVYADPRPEGYQSRENCTPGQLAQAFVGNVRISIAAADVLPPTAPATREE
jgi:Uma2 family endonuclease